MILPVVVFWRLYLRANPITQRWLLPAIAASTVVCLILSLPRHFGVHLATREFGRTTAYRIGDYEDAYEPMARSAWSLGALLPDDYRLAYPNQPWGTDAFSWIFYASREKDAQTAINYIVQAASQAVPTGTQQVLQRDGVSVFVRDQATWQRHRDQEIPRVVVSPLYEPILRQALQFFRRHADAVQQGLLETSVDETRPPESERSPPSPAPRR